jgi:hypothetical protein
LQANDPLRDASLGVNVAKRGKPFLNKSVCRTSAICHL